MLSRKTRIILSHGSLGIRLNHNFRQIKIRLPESDPKVTRDRLPSSIAADHKQPRLDFADNFFEVGSSQDQKPLKHSNPRAVPISLLHLDENQTLPYRDFPSDLPTPYDLQNREREANKQIGAPSEPKRLSVSSLSPGWCELRKLYDIYASFHPTTTKEMIGGTLIHEKLEVESHPDINTDEIISAYIKAAEAAPEDAYTGVQLLLTEERINELMSNEPAFAIAQQVTRLMSLFTTGHAREIQVFAFFDKQTFELIDAESSKNTEDEDNFVMSRGVIDHLILTPSMNAHDYSLLEELQLYENDLSEFCKFAPEILATSEYWPTITVSDVKTRGWRSIPKQLNVLRSNEFQVFCYRKFLGILGGQSYKDATKADKRSSLAFCYDLLVANARRRNIDLDTPILPELIIPLIFKNDWLIADAVRLKKGEAFGFPHFDDLPPSKMHYDISYLKPLNYMHESLDSELFNGRWENPLTIRFLLFRLAQLFQIMEPHLADECSIEYVLRSGDSLEPFRTTYHRYDNTLVNKGLRHSAQFYFSNEADKVELIDPKSFKTYCEPTGRTSPGCRYREWCGWYQEQRTPVQRAR